jgi:Putative effector of murein hydrolase LrgA
MKYMLQLTVILIITFIGEALNRFIPLPIPASIYGMIILFAALKSGLLHLEQVKDVGKFLIDIMPLMFIPAAVGLLEAWPALQHTWIQIILTSILTTFIVMAVAGRVTQAVMRQEVKKHL